MSKTLHLCGSFRHFELSYAENVMLWKRDWQIFDPLHASPAAARTRERWLEKALVYGHHRNLVNAHQLCL